MNPKCRMIAYISHHGSIFGNFNYSCPDIPVGNGKHVWNTKVVRNMSGMPLHGNVDGFPKLADEKHMWNVT